MAVDDPEIVTEPQPRRAGVGDRGRDRTIGGRRQRTGDELPSVLEDRRLLAGDLRDRITEVGHVVHGDAGDDGDGGVDHVGGVEPPPKPDLDHGDIDPGSGERLKAIAAVSSK